MPFSEDERVFLLATPRVGPGVVARLEEAGIDSLSALRHAGVEAVVKGVCDRLGTSGWANRQKALLRALERTSQMNSAHALAKMTAASSTVMRDGKLQRVPVGGHDTGSTGGRAGGGERLRIEGISQVCETGLPEQRAKWPSTHLDLNFEQLHGVDEHESVGTQVNDRRLDRSDPAEQRCSDAEHVHHAYADEEVLLDGAVGEASNGTGCGEWPRSSQAVLPNPVRRVR